MTQFSRLIKCVLAFLVLVVAGFAQENSERPNRDGGNRPQGGRQDMSSEDWKKQQVQIINNKVADFMKKMGDNVPQDKVQDVSRMVGEHLVGELKIRMAMQAAIQEAGKDRETRRKVMAASQDKLKKLMAETNKKAKGILDRKALKSFEKNLEELMPEPGSGGAGGGRGGQGGGGGGGQGGGGGGGGGGR